MRKDADSSKKTESEKIPKNQKPLRKQFDRFIESSNTRARKDDIGKAVADCNLALSLKEIDLTKSEEDLLKDKISKVLYNALPISYWIDLQSEDPLSSLNSWIKEKLNSIIQLCVCHPWQPPLITLKHQYENQITAFKNKTNGLRQAHYSQIIIPHKGHYLIESDIARYLIDNKTGLVTHYRDKKNEVNLYFKINSGDNYRLYPKDSDFYSTTIISKKKSLNPLYEYAAIIWHHLINGDINTVISANLVLLRHVPMTRKYEDETEEPVLVTRPLLAITGIQGELVQNMIKAAGICSFWKKTLNDNNAATETLQLCLQDKFISEYKKSNHSFSKLNENEYIDPDHQLFYIEALQKDLARHLGEQCLLKDRSKWKKKKTGVEALIEQAHRYTWGDWLWTLAFLKQYYHLIPSFHGLLNVIGYNAALKSLARLTPTLTSPERFLYAINWPQTEQDSLHYSNWWLTNLLIDNSGDSFLIHMPSHQILATEYSNTFEKGFYLRDKRHYLKLKNPVYCFQKAMEQIVHPTTREQFLKKTPEEWLLDWLEILTTNKEFIEQWYQQGLLDKKNLNIYLAFKTDLLPNLLDKVKKIHYFLSENTKPQHGDLLKLVYPALANYYSELRKKYPDPLILLQLLYQQDQLPSFEEQVVDIDDPLIQALAKETETTIDSCSITKMAQQLAAEWGNLSNQSQEYWVSTANRLGKLKVIHWKGLPKKFHREEILFYAVQNALAGLIDLILSNNVKLHLKEQSTLITSEKNDNVWHAYANIFSSSQVSENQIFNITKILCQRAADLLNEPNEKQFYPLFNMLDKINQKPKRTKSIIRLLLQYGLRGDVTQKGKNNKGETIQETVIDLAIRQAARSKEIDDAKTVQILMSLGFGRWIEHTKSAIEYFKNSQSTADDIAFKQWQKQQPQVGLKIALESISAARASTSHNFEIHGVVSGKQYLKENIVAQFYNRDDNTYRPDKSENCVTYGPTSVIKIKNGLDGTLHMAFFPELPSLAYMIESFCRHLFGAGLIAASELFLFPNKTPVLISLNIVDANLQEKGNNNFDNTWANLDRSNFTEQLLSSLLYRPENANPDNYIYPPCVYPPDLSKNCLIRTPDGRAFVEAAKTQNNWDGSKTASLQLINILYCVEQMNGLLSPSVVKRFLKTNLHSFLKKWLMDCIEYEQKCMTLFKEKWEHWTNNLPNRTRLIVGFCKRESIKKKIKTLTDHLPTNIHLFLLLYQGKKDWYAAKIYCNNSKQWKEKNILEIINKNVVTPLNKLTLSSLRESTMYYKIYDILRSKLKYPKNTSVIFGMPLPELTIAGLYNRACRLQELLKQKKPQTGFRLLRALSPVAYYFYKEAFYTKDTPLKRFEIIAKNKYLRLGKGHYYTTCSGLDLIQDEGISKKSILKREYNTPYSLTDKDKTEIEKDFDFNEKVLLTGAGKLTPMLYELHQTIIEKKQIIRINYAWKQNKPNNISNLRLAISFEIFFKNVSFEHIAENQQIEIWTLLQKRKIKFNELTIKHAKYLTNEILDIILAQSPNLKKLYISTCINITELAFHKLDKHCPHLYLLHLQQLSRLVQLDSSIKSTSGFQVKLKKSKTKKSKIKELELPLLRFLFLEQLPALTNVYINDPAVLQSLKIKSCTKLKNLPKLLDTLNPSTNITLKNTSLEFKKLTEYVINFHAWENHHYLFDRLIKNFKLDLSSFSINAEETVRLSKLIPTGLLQELILPESTLTSRILISWLNSQSTLRKIGFSVKHSLQLSAKNRKQEIAHIKELFNISDALLNDSTGQENCAFFSYIEWEDIENKVTDSLANHVFDKLKDLANQSINRKISSKFKIVYELWQLVIQKVSLLVFKNLAQCIWFFPIRNPPQLRSHWRQVVLFRSSILEAPLWGQTDLPNKTSIRLCLFTLFSKENQDRLALVNKQWNKVVSIYAKF